MSKLLRNTICPVMYSFDSNNNDSHFLWIIRDSQGNYLRVEPHGSRPDLNTEQILKATRGSMLVIPNDIQPVNIGACRLASTYALLSYIFQLNFLPSGKLKALDKDTAIDYNRELSKYPQTPEARPKRGRAAESDISDAKRGKLMP
jgi:hypothetical protein